MCAYVHLLCVSEVQEVHEIVMTWNVAVKDLLLSNSQI